MKEEESCTLLLESLYILDQIHIGTVSMWNELDNVNELLHLVFLFLIQLITTLKKILNLCL
jgi:hypothetical protein